MSIKKKVCSNIEEVEKDIKEVLQKVMKIMHPKNLVSKNLYVNNNTIIFGEKYRVSLKNINNIYIVGFGKASGSMAEETEKILGDLISKGIVIIPRGTKEKYNVRKIKFAEADHPIPSVDNINGAKKIVGLLRKAEKKDIIIMLISGGGSALMSLPKKGFTLEEIARTTEIVMKAGANINELNAVRKHLSMVKGGQLVRYAYPAKIYSLIISDVVGDPLDTIASGPTSPDTTTYQDAYNVLRKYNLLDKAPPKVIRHFKWGIQGMFEETPKPYDKLFNIVHNIIIGNNRMALEKALEIFSRKGYRGKILSSYIEGEARDVGIVIAGIAREINEYNRPFRKPVILLGGGETTVRVVGNGVGGRSQELVLSAGMKIRGIKNIIIASIGTDGIDGNSPAAGAIINGKDVEEGIRRGIDPYKYLYNNDSFNYFNKIGGLIVTGPSGTNINDIMVIGVF